MWVCTEFSLQSCPDSPGKSQCQSAAVKICNTRFTPEGVTAVTGDLTPPSDLEVQLQELSSLLDFPVAPWAKLGGAPLSDPRFKLCDLMPFGLKPRGACSSCIPKSRGGVERLSMPHQKDWPAGRSDLG